MLTKTATIGTLLCCHTLMILNLVTAVDDAEYDGAKKLYKKQPNIVIIIADDMVSYLLQEQNALCIIMQSIFGMGKMCVNQ